MKRIILVGAGVAVAGLAYAMWPMNDQTQTVPSETAAVGTGAGALAEVLLPETLSQNAQVGKLAFEAKCSTCHGLNAAGLDGAAPPLVHIIYEPNHHGDESFQRAAELGVRSHHWNFGDMPAVEGMTRGDVIMIVAYIRELQRANGIN